jgi:hypothetical protein
MHGSFESSLSLRFRQQNPVYTSPLSHTCYMPCNLILLDLITRTIFGERLALKFLNTKFNLGLNTELFRIFVFCNSLQFRDTTLNYRMMWCKADVVDLLYGRCLVRISPNTGCSNKLFRGFSQCYDSRPTCIRSQSLPSKSSPFHHLW